MDLTAVTAAVPPLISTLAIGALTCFMGYHLRKIWVAIAGLVFGFTAGQGAAVLFIDASTAALIGLGLGIVAMLICIWLYDAGIFVLCGGCAVLFLQPYFSAAGLPQYVYLLCLAGVFVVAGVLALRFVKPVLIVVTSFSGAGSIVSSLAGLGIPYISAVGAAGLICTLVVAIAGIVVQFSNARGR